MTFWAWSQPLSALSSERSPFEISTLVSSKVGSIISYLFHFSAFYKATLSYDLSDLKTVHNMSPIARLGEGGQLKLFLPHKVMPRQGEEFSYLKSILWGEKGTPMRGIVLKYEMWGK